MTPLSPGQCIGILGGGQLGRMLALAAERLGFDVHIFTDDEDSPAARVSARATIAKYDNPAALKTFANAVSVVTTEFENVPAETLAALAAAGVTVRPNAQALALAQDRIDEKALFESLGVATAPHAPIDNRAEFDAALERIGVPAIFKTRRLGYDGKGQVRIQTMEDADAAFAALAGQRAVLEGFCAFEREVSIVAARGADGAFAAYDLVENEHRKGVLHRSIAPARCGPDVQIKAGAITRRIAEALDYVGVLAVEFFLMPDGTLIANEMAPRVHNSGHWTLDACEVDQFEQQIRAVAGWPLGPTRRLADAEMVNLIGADVARWDALIADPSARLHLYGKRETRAGRKMGHVTRLTRRD